MSSEQCHERGVASPTGGTSHRRANAAFLLPRRQDIHSVTPSRAGVVRDVAFAWFKCQNVTSRNGEARDWWYGDVVLAPPGREYGRGYVLPADLPTERAASAAAAGGGGPAAAAAAERHRSSEL